MELPSVSCDHSFPSPSVGLAIARATSSLPTIVFVSNSIRREENEILIEREVAREVDRKEKTEKFQGRQKRATNK